jgi:predicted class III extradiol MEMO1 family dioxygenase
MSEDTTPYIGSDGDFYMDEDEIKLWDNTLMDGLKEIKVEELIDKIKNYYNTCCDINGRPPSKIEFNEFVDSLEKNS